MWTMLNNGVCPPDPPAGFRFVSTCSGTDNQLAVDNAGRVFTWGTSSYTYTGQTPVSIPSTPNFSPSAAQFDGSGSGYMMLYPYQVGNKSNYIKAQIYERQFVALDTDGFLWAWGDGYYGIGGWSLTGQYAIHWGPPKYYIPGGDIALIPQQINAFTWLDFCTGYSHILALGTNKRAYVWGTDYWGGSWGMPSYAAGSKSLTPILVNTLPDVDIKLIHASADNCGIVTESNVIYIWGEFSFDNFTSPTILPLTLPSGIVVTQIVVTYAGVLVLLSNGDCYAKGESLQFAGPPDYYFDNLTLIPGGHHFVFLSAFEYTAGGLDTQGNIWGWGYSNYFISRDDTFCDEESYLPGSLPELVASPAPGMATYTWFSVGNTSHAAITSEGRCFTWGSDLWGQLGIDGDYWANPDHQCVAVEVAKPTLDTGELAYEATGVGIAAIQIFIPTPEQISEHNPCGHWHRGVHYSAGETLDIPVCCWDFALDINGADVVLYGLGIRYPHPCIALRYNISTRMWYGPYWIKTNFYTSQWLAGGSIDGAFDAVMAFGGTSALDGSISNYRIRIIATHHPTGTIYDKELVTSVAQVCEGKIVVVDATGYVVALVETGSSLQAQYSSNRGNTYSIGHTWTFSGTYKYARIIHDGTAYFVGLFYLGGNIEIYRSTDVVTWTLQSSITAPAGATKFNMWYDGATLFVICHNRLFYSINSGMSFTTRNLSDTTNFVVADGATKSATAFYTDRLENTPDYTISSPTWNNFPVVPSIDYELNDYTTVRNSGDFVVYMRDNIFVASRIVLPVSQTLGAEWELVQSPIDHFASNEESFFGKDDPRWKFSEQQDKILLDPQYR